MKKTMIKYNSMEDFLESVDTCDFEMNQYFYDKLKYAIDNQLKFIDIFSIEQVSGVEIIITVEESNFIEPLMKCLRKFEQYEQYELCIECNNYIKMIS